MQLGQNDAVDTISSDQLEALRKELLEMTTVLPTPEAVEAVMYRVAPRMHAAASQAFTAAANQD